MSLHSAKGLEYRAVFLPGLEEGLLPHARSAQRLQDIEEERRLCYVGMTRAKEMLWLSYAQVRMLGGHGVTGQPSRFIGEIGLQHMALKVSAAKRLKPRLATASAGDRVHHTRWGAGTVEQVEGVGQAALTTILFDSAGRRRLQLCHAPLTLHRESSADVSAG
jgi:DNA helicase-2/ATP-dependent DNA helicase PcrA